MKWVIEQEQHLIRRKNMNNLITYLTLDFDDTYDNEDPDGNGVQPLIYAVPLHRLEEVEHLATESGEEFNASDSNSCIGDIFERQLIDAGIAFQLIGTLDLSFEERQMDYLADYLPHVIV